MITNFKTFEGLTENHIEVIDLIIDMITEDFFNKDFIFLEMLLNKIDKKNLVYSLSESEWNYYKNKNKDIIINKLIKFLYSEHKVGDYIILDELLGFIPEEELIKSLPEGKWEEYLIKKNVNKYNL